MGHFARWEGHGMSQIGMQTFMAGLSQDAEGWSLLEDDGNEEEDIMVIEDGVYGKVHVVLFFDTPGCLQTVKAFTRLRKVGKQEKVY